MSRTILLADDSLAIQKVVKLTFETTDFDVEVLSSGDEALRELSRIEPAIVIADVHMPGASGYEVARRVKAERPGTPVLLLVGTFEAFDEEESAASGADEHMLKPFESAKLRERVEALAPIPKTPVPKAPAPETSAPETPAPKTPADSETGAGESAGAVDDVAPPEDEADEDTLPVEMPGSSAGGGSGTGDSATAPPEPTLPSREDAAGDSREDEPTEVVPVPASTDTVPETVEATPQSVDTGAGDAEPVDAVPVEAVPVEARPVEARPVEIGTLDADSVDRIARRVVELISAESVERIARDVVPRLAEEAVRRRIEELERDVD